MWLCFSCPLPLSTEGSARTIQLPLNLSILALQLRDCLITRDSLILHLVLEGPVLGGSSGALLLELGIIVTHRLFSLLVHAHAECMRLCPFRLENAEGAMRLQLMTAQLGFKIGCALPLGIKRGPRSDQLLLDCTIAMHPRL